jgi:hypothetical protein
MSLLASNYFSYPLINTSLGCNADGIDPTEIINFLFKKQLGFANTAKVGLYYIEGNNYNSFKPTTTNLLFSQYIPPIPPTDLIEIPFCNINEYSNISGQIKYISSNYPYLAYYSNVCMNSAGSSQQSVSAFTISKFARFEDDGGDIYYNQTYANILTKNAIPFSYGVSAETGENNYKSKIILRNSNLNHQLYFGTIDNGSWIFDTDSGILTFYDNVTTVTVNRSTPPRISFWRYEGLIGNNTIMNIADF